MTCGNQVDGSQPAHGFRVTSHGFRIASKRANGFCTRSARLRRHLQREFFPLQVISRLAREHMGRRGKPSMCGGAVNLQRRGL